MTRPHSVCWIVAATAMVVLLSPSPAGVSTDNEPVSILPAPAAAPCSGTFDAASGPWLVGRLLVPYPAGIAPARLPTFARALAEPRHATADGAALEPWDLERLLAPYPVGIGSHRFAAFAPRPVTAPGAAAEGRGLGPWDLERLLVPYPTTLTLEQIAGLTVMPEARLPQQAPAPVDSQLGPWRVEQFVCPYQLTVAPPPADEPTAQAAPPPADWAAEQAVLPWPAELTGQWALPWPAEPTEQAALPWPAEPTEQAALPWPAEPTEQAALPWPAEPTEQAALPWPAEPTEQAALPRPAPTTLDPALGPWDVERLLVPYPARVTLKRLPEYAGPITMPLWPAAAEVRPHERLMMRVTATTRRLVGLLEQGTRAARRALKDLRPPATPTLGGPRASSQHGARSVPTRSDGAQDGLQKLIEALDAFAPRPASWPDDDRANSLMPWREGPQTASDPFALEQRWTDVAAEPNVAAPAILPDDDPSRPVHVAGLERFFPPSTGIAFLAALLLVPASCSYAAGAVYGYARDGPPWRP